MSLTKRHERLATGQATLKAATHPIRCTCGAVKGELELSRDINRCLCYCKDCQAFAHFLGRAGEILDAQGGTEVIHTAPRRIRLMEGREKLACVRLTDKGMLRWYASCCKTPLGNTLASPGMSFVGLVHSCLGAAPRPLDEVFGPMHMRVNGASAIGIPKPRDEHVLGAIVQLVGMMARERLNGGYRQTPFFTVTRQPVATPRVLSVGERLELSHAVDRQSRT
jgi:hypothetical protein